MTSDDESTRFRTIGCITTPAGDGCVTIDHVYTMKDCEHGEPDEGLIGLVAHDHETGQETHVLLGVDEALLIANRLTRAASLVMESGEDLPDVEREYRRHTRRRSDQDG